MVGSREADASVHPRRGRRADRQRSGRPRQPGAGETGPAGRCPGSLLRRPDRQGSPASISTSTAAPMSAWSSNRTLQPTCTRATADPSTTRPTNWSRLILPRPADRSKPSTEGKTNHESSRQWPRACFPPSRSARLRRAAVAPGHPALPEAEPDVKTRLQPRAAAGGTVRGSHRHGPWWPASATCSCATTASARRSHAAWPQPRPALAGSASGGLRNPRDASGVRPAGRRGRLVLVDTVPPDRARCSDTGQHPGPALGARKTSRQPRPLDPHGMDPAAVLDRLRSLGGKLPPTYVVGCVPADMTEGIGLSPRWRPPCRRRWPPSSHSSKKTFPIPPEEVPHVPRNTGPGHRARRRLRRPARPRGCGRGGSGKSTSGCWTTARWKPAAGS